MSDTTVAAADPGTVGSWELLPFHSEVLAIHTALLPAGKVLFFGRRPRAGRQPKRPAPIMSRSSDRRIFPLTVLGSSSTK